MTTTTMRSRFCRVEIMRGQCCFLSFGSSHQCRPGTQYGFVSLAYNVPAFCYGKMERDIEHGHHEVMKTAILLTIEACGIRHGERYATRWAGYSTVERGN